MADQERFYVYNNWRRDRGRVHRGDCPHCNCGLGRAGSTHGTNDEFRGPFSRDAAFADAASLGRREMQPCGVCNP